ncbi:hypothetical protein DSECCO2_367280 [anaerobic digester metagenome]
MTFRPAIRDVAIESATVRATGSPSGIAETASATARKKTSRGGTPWPRTMIASSPVAARTAMLIFREKSSMRRTSGGLPVSDAVTVSAICPISVCWPVATTTPLPRPVMTVLPA